MEFSCLIFFFSFPLYLLVLGFRYLQVLILVLIIWPLLNYWTKEKSLRTIVTLYQSHATRQKKTHGVSTSFLSLLSSCSLSLLLCVHSLFDLSFFNFLKMSLLCALNMLSSKFIHIDIVLAIKWYVPAKRTAKKTFHFLSL